jgi:2-polyprenyl-6-methoxyphenol hydroxylase-like FAD-dependent oxidoreductase
MKAVIVGAGIAGLVAARQLGLAGWDVELLEKSAAPRPDGYMMDFFGPGVEAAERIGLYPRLTAVAYHVEAAEYVDPAGRPTSSIDYDQFARLAGGKVLSLLRPDMERAALAALDDVASGRVRVRYGAAVSQVWRDDDGVRVAVEDSPDMTFAADVLTASIPECAPRCSVPKRSTCAPWACVLPPSS